MSDRGDGGRMDDETLAELQRLSDEATAPPWGAADEHGLIPGAAPAWCVSRMDGETWLHDVFYHASQSDGRQAEIDSQFAAAARNALPLLLRELGDTRALVATLEHRARSRALTARARGYSTAEREALDDLHLIERAALGATDQAGDPE